MADKRVQDGSNSEDIQTCLSESHAYLRQVEFEDLSSPNLHHSNFKTTISYSSKAT